MKRTIAGLWLGTLAVALGVSCSEDEKGDEEGTGGAGPDGTGGMGAIILDGGDEANGQETTPCENIEGIDAACEFVAQEAQQLLVNMLLVVDKSGSMAETPPSYATSKWEAMKQALSAALTEVQNAMSFGLEFFPTTATPGNPIPAECAGPPDRCCEMPGDLTMNVDVGPGTTTVPLIINALSTEYPTGGTPTATALQRAYAYFTAGPGAALEGGKYVLLATDGGPNCNSGLSCTIETCTLNLDNAPGCPSLEVNPSAISCCGNRPEGCLDDAQAAAAIGQLASIGVGTIVVGIPGAEIYREVLNSMAVQSSFQRENSDIPYYLVSAEGGVAELTQTFTDITTELVTDCEVPLDVDQANYNPNEVNVAVDCVVIPRGEAGDEGDRWFFDNPDNPTSIIIDGDICDTIQTQGVGRIDVVLGCPTRWVP
jgi:hypothetical protein